MQKFPKIANTSSIAPNNKEGKVKNFPDWNFAEMINVAHDVKWIELEGAEVFVVAVNEIRKDCALLAIFYPYLAFVFTGFSPN
jgi:hypothetical protein